MGLTLGMFHARAMPGGLNTRFTLSSGFWGGRVSWILSAISESGGDGSGRGGRCSNESKPYKYICKKVHGDHLVSTDKSGKTQVYKSTSHSSILHQSNERLYQKNKDGLMYCVYVLVHLSMYTHMWGGQRTTSYAIFH